MKTIRLTLIFVLSIGLLGPSAAVGDDAVLEQHFTRTAQQHGTAYQIGRDLLERQGKAVVPLLKQKQEAKDWRERLLARSLLLRIDAPDQVARWRRILDYGFNKFGLSKDGTIQLQLDGDLVTFDRRSNPHLSGREARHANG